MVCNYRFFFSTYAFNIASVVHCLTFFYIDKVFLRIWAVPVSAIYCISARFGLPGIFSRYFSVPFLIIPKAPNTNGIVTVFKCHTFPTSISGSLCLDSFSNSATETFLYTVIFTLTSLQVFSLLPLTVMSLFFALIFLSVCMLQSHKMVTLSVSVTASG